MTVSRALERTILVVAAAFPLVGFGTPTSSILDGVAAWVNESAVTVGEVMALVAPVRRQLATAYSGSELERRTQRAYEEALESLVVGRLLRGHSSTEKMEIPDWVVDRQVEETIRQRFGGDRTALLEALAQDRISYSEWRQMLRDQLLVSYLTQKYVEARAYVSPRALREAYESRRETYQTGGRVRLRMIMLRKKGGAEADAAYRLAQAVRERVAAGENFAAVAREMSEDRRAAEGGDWGWIRPDILRPELARLAETLPVGTISDPVETSDAVYVLYVEGREEKRPQPLTEVALRLARELRAQERERLRARWVARLKRQACVRVLHTEPQPEGP